MPDLIEPAPEPVSTPTTEPVQTPSTEPATTPTEPTEFNFHSFIEPNGKLKEGWKNGLPEELRGELSLDTFDSFPEAMRQTVMAQKMVGKDKVVIPTEKSTQAEWDAFYSKIGRPQTPDGYEYKAPEDLKAVDLSPEFVNPVLQELHKAGATKKVVDVAMNQFHKFVKNLEASAEEAENQAFDEASQKIIETRGDTLEADQHEANLLIAENSPNEEYKEKLLEVINDNALRPYLFGFLADVRKKYFGSHEGMPSGESTGTVKTPASLRAQAQEIQATPGYMDGTMRNQNPAQYNRLTQQISNMYNQADEIEKRQKQ